jgi:Cyclic nucleotide-binding domain
VRFIIVRSAVISGSELQKEIGSISRIRHVRAGETILAESAPSNIVGNVVSGALRLVKTLSDGRQQIVGLLLPSDMFGRVFASSSRFAVEAATDAVLCCFDRSAFEVILARIANWNIICSSHRSTSLMQRGTVCCYSDAKPFLNGSQRFFSASIGDQRIRAALGNPVRQVPSLQSQ